MRGSDADVADAGGPATRWFGRFWAAAAVSSFGSAVTGVAMPVLVVRTLEASAFEVGLVSAAQFVPYAALGVLAGAYVDRWRRRPVIVVASLGRALCLVVIGVLGIAGVLEIWMLVAALLAFGTFAVFGFAATQSFLPRLVARQGLVTANARLDQTDATAQTLGPALGGGLIGVLGAPLAIIADAVSYVVEAILVARIRVEEPGAASARGRLAVEVGEGLRWMYRHATLGPLAISTHVWFLGNGAAMTVLSLLALRTLGLDAVVFGLLMATFGVAGVIGASLASRVGARVGAGRVIIAARAVYPIAWVLPVASAFAGNGVVLLFVALALLGLAAGVENPNEMGLWQSLTPDRLLGRVNANRRAANRTMAALGALVGGVIAGVVGERPTLVLIIVAFAIAALIVAFSPLRRAAHPGSPASRRSP